MKELWLSEGILPDPTHTAIAMTGLTDLALRGECVDKRAVFLHTGGIPSIVDSSYHT